MKDQLVSLGTVSACLGFSEWLCVPWSLVWPHHCPAASAVPGELTFDSTCGFMRKSSALKGIRRSEHLTRLQSRVWPQARWAASLSRPAAQFLATLHPVRWSHLTCFLTPFSICATDQLVSCDFIHSLHVLILLCRLIQLWSDYIHTSLKSHSVSFRGLYRSFF